jgi:ankyrin repeat protein
MPPAGPLAPKQINVIKDWIDQGANWPDELSGERDTALASPTAIKIVNSLRNRDGKEFARLLRENPDAVNAKGSGGWTPIMYAAFTAAAELSACRSTRARTRMPRTTTVEPP